MAGTTLDRASRLSTKAVRGFEKAHTKLTKAQELFAQHEDEQRAAAEEWRRQVEAAIAAAEAQAKAAKEMREKNSKKIALLSDLIA